MSVVAIIGAQWGDEGKGKIVDVLAEKADAVIRFSGGDNAGHTVINPRGEFKLHIVPSGIFYPRTACIIGNGLVINPKVLIEELDSLKARGVDVGNLHISDRAHLIMPWHLLLDGLEEEKRGHSALGTTKKGIGPAFADKTARIGIRTCDLIKFENFKSRLSEILEIKNEILEKVYNLKPLDFDSILKEYDGYATRLIPHIKDTTAMVNDLLEKGGKVVLEGAQGAMLDPDFGSYPFVTSSSPLAAGACIGSGISPRKIDRVVGIFKAYTTRVGGGPMPTELTDAVGEYIRQHAHEYGATTGRARRCGWFDAVVGRYTTQLNGFTSAILTRLDVLDEMDTVKICIAYKENSSVIDRFPADVNSLDRCEPVYEELPGWKATTSDIRDFKKLPVNARKYIRRIEELIECSFHIISIGPRRDQSIIIKRII
ncbi:MAG: adenylosuccinate synthase [Dehalococcoidia bacterium]|nr:adenylosuccinate synthase [Dehalococcoidia bacterium]MDD5495380.1 adenylosuccinate synthase [Dehalococcoidia bacterium]